MELLEMRPPCQQSGSELLATLDALHADAALKETYRLQALARLEEMGYATEVGARDTTELISVRHRLNRKDVKRDLHLAKDLTKYPVVSAALPDPYADPDPDDPDLDLDLDPEDSAAAADAAGEGGVGPVVLNLLQAAAIITALNKVPNTVPVEDLQVAEEQMVQAARHLSPGDLRTLGQRVVDTLDTDGPEPAEDAAYQREKLWLHRADHGIKFGGFLAAENAELFQTAIDGLSKPHKTIDGELDPRPRDKRHADALVTILETAAGNPDATPGVPHLMVTIDYEDLKNATSQALGDLMFSGTTLSAAAIRRIACDAAILPIVLGTNSQPLDVGTEQRFVNRAIRRALIKRDKGCIICKAPPPYCHAHHITHWIDGGPTSLNNLALFCGGHHHAIHKGHYTVTITNGTVHVTRPTWADPTPKPTRRIHLPQPTTPATPTPTPRPTTARLPHPQPAPGTAPNSGTTPGSATTPTPGSAAPSTPGQRGRAHLRPQPRRHPHRHGRPHLPPHRDPHRSPGRDRCCSRCSSVSQPLRPTPAEACPGSPQKPPPASTPGAKTATQPPAPNPTAGQSVGRLSRSPVVGRRSEPRAAASSGPSIRRHAPPNTACEIKPLI